MSRQSLAAATTRLRSAVTGTLRLAWLLKMIAIPTAAMSEPTSPATRNVSTRCATASSRVNSGTTAVMTAVVPAGASWRPVYRNT